MGDSKIIPGSVTFGPFDPSAAKRAKIMSIASDYKLLYEIVQDLAKLGRSDWDAETHALVLRARRALGQ